MFRKGEKINSYGLFEDSSEHDSTALDLGGIGSLLAGIEKSLESMSITTYIENNKRDET